MVAAPVTAASGGGGVGVAEREELGAVGKLGFRRSSVVAELWRNLSSPRRDGDGGGDDGAGVREEQLFCFFATKKWCEEVYVRNIQLHVHVVVNSNFEIGKKRKGW